MINLEPHHRELVNKNLKEYVPEFDVFAFGSRVSGTAKPYSDLDLTIMTTSPLPLSQLARLKEAFSESDLPMKVDIVDWSTLSDDFREIIKQSQEIIQKKKSND